MIPDNYKGREQAFVKHTLLKAYLERLLMIIGRHEHRISYVDCFAGPWLEGSDDLSDTSIAISLEIMRKCHYGLRNTFGKTVHFRALFIEKERKAFEKLRGFLGRGDDGVIETDCLQGEFFDLRNHILHWCGRNDFVFFFIDPKGWKNAIEIPTLRPLLNRDNSEFLINFMYDFLVRAHSQKAFESEMEEIFGEVPDTHRMESKEREMHLLRLYREHLKRAQTRTGGLPRSAYVKVLDPCKDRTKYHLVYLTRHPRGVKVFMEESEKLDLIQKQVRAQAKQNHRVDKTGQMELFSAYKLVKENGEDEVDISAVRDYWLSKLTSTQKRFGIEQLADMLEETDWFISDFQRAFVELEKEGYVRNVDARRKRPKNPVNFDKDSGRGEHLEKVRS
jgi:three-Cys-motif partner protein